jgi:hypothetical protein
VNGLDILAIVALLVIVFIGARKLDEHERWMNRRHLRDECWAKVAELNKEQD